MLTLEKMLSNMCHFENGIFTISDRDEDVQLKHEVFELRDKINWFSETTKGWTDSGNIIWYEKYYIIPRDSKDRTLEYDLDPFIWKGLVEDIDVLINECGDRPSEALALRLGISDNSYSTVRHGRVASYDGVAEVTLRNGSRWKMIGHPTTGTPDYLRSSGFIEYIRIS